MLDDKEILLRLERLFQKEIVAQKKFYESQIELLKSEYELRLKSSEAELENKIRFAKEDAEALYNIKSMQDKEKIEKYYKKELQSQREWYEKEIERRLKESENWHVNNLEQKLKGMENWHVNNLDEKLNALKNGYEEILKRKSEEIEEIKENFKKQETALLEFIDEQKNIYEAQLKPFKKFIRLRDKIKRKFKFLSQKPAAKAENADSFQNRHVHTPPEEALLTNHCFKEEDVSKSPSPPAGEGRGEGFKNNEKLTNPSDEENMECLRESIPAPKVSIIVPVYNVEKYLRQSLDSLINQTLKDIEIICIDDGSTDNSGAVLDEYAAKDSRIKVIHKSNKGTGAARNDGLRTAMGECIGFVDPDDWVKPDMFEKLYKEIKEKNLDIAACMPDGWDEKNNKNAPFPYFVDDNFKILPENKIFNWRDLSPFKYPMCVWNKLYTKKLFDDNHIDFAEGLDFEDHKVIFGTLLTAQRMSFMSEKLYVYRYNREGSVLTDNNRRLIDHIKIFDIVENLMKETNTFEPLRDDFLTYKIHNMLYYYSMIKDEYKKDYYAAMTESLKNTKLTDDEYKKLSEKYPELKEINI